MAQYGYILRLYALLYVIIFVGGPLRAGLQALEFTVPIFWSYLAMTAFAFAFAVPMAKWLGLSGSLLGLIGRRFCFKALSAPPCSSDQGAWRGNRRSYFSLPPGRSKGRT
jgi:hypothetical protein